MNAIIFKKRIRRIISKLRYFFDNEYKTLVYLRYKKITDWKNKRRRKYFKENLTKKDWIDFFNDERNNLEYIKNFFDYMLKLNRPTDELELSLIYNKPYDYFYITIDKIIDRMFFQNRKGINVFFVEHCYLGLFEIKKRMISDDRAIMLKKINEDKFMLRNDVKEAYEEVFVKK